jgi:hypothetical protein
VAVFAVSPWRALPESFFAHFRRLKIHRCASPPAEFDSKVVRVRKESKMPGYACNPKGAGTLSRWRRKNDRG